MKEGDSYLMKGRRRILVENIRAKGITDENVLKAIGEVLRHLFVVKGSESRAYDDTALSITDGQTISQPFTVAFQTQLLEISTNDKVLEIGTGSGYQAAVLAEIGAQVYTIERIKNLYDKTSELLKTLGYDNIHCFYGDGYKGLPEYQPFDKMIITAAIPTIPKDLFSQLKIDGYLVAPVGESGYSQVMTRFIKISETEIKKETYGHFSFVPMKKGLI